MNDLTWGMLFGGLTMLIIFIVLTALSPDGAPGYKQGQIDALTGKVKYVLIENPDKTKEWVRDDSTRKD